MSNIGSVGHHHHQHQVGSATQTQATTATDASAATSSSTAASPADSLKAIQGLAQQLESAANTRAIPAHQNW